MQVVVADSCIFVALADFGTEELELGYSDARGKRGRGGDGLGAVVGQAHGHVL